jgi:AcrR family transcriptional regulator
MGNAILSEQRRLSTTLNREKLAHAQRKKMPRQYGAQTVDSAERVDTGAQAGTLIEKNHQQIVDGACRIFFKKGFHPTTTRDIAKACGMSIGQLYHYITSKDDVLFLVHKHSQKIWHDYLKKVDHPPAADPLQRLREKSLSQSRESTP